MQPICSLPPTCAHMIPQMQIQGPCRLGAANHNLQTSDLCMFSIPYNTPAPYQNPMPMLVLFIKASIANTEFGMKPQIGGQKKGSGGRGFGEAMFGIKDIMAEYGEIEGRVDKPPLKETKPAIIRKELPTKGNGVQIVKKEPLPANKAQQGSQPKKVELGPAKQPPVFKVSSGKEFESMASQVLVPIEVSPNAFELSIDGTPSTWEYHIFCDGVEARHIVSAPEVSFAFDVTQVMQGGLGNCYFIATLASMTHLKSILRDRIPQCESYGGDDKSYSVNLFESGKNIRMIVDNLFPKVFTKPVGNDISPMILEKAYAQAYGNFEVINMGHSCDSMRDMTGAPTEYIDLKDESNLTQKIQWIFQQRFPIVIASKPVVKMDLSPKHSYNVVDYRVRQSQLFLKLRDPRGRNFSYFPQLVQITDFQSQNGMFWVDHRILVENFEVITVCKAVEGNKYFYKAFRAVELTNNQGCLRFRIKQRGNFSFSCHQKHKKFFDEKYAYSMLRILLARVEMSDGRIIPVETIASEFNTKNVCTVEAALEPGHYILLAKIGNSNFRPKMQSEVMTISTYTDIPKAGLVEFEVIRGHVPVEPFLSLYMANNQHLFRQSSTDNLYRCFGPLFGYICIYFDNKSGRSAHQKLAYNCQNVFPKQDELILKANETSILLHPIGEKNNCSHSFSFKIKTLFK